MTRTAPPNPFTPAAKAPLARMEGQVADRYGRPLIAGSAAARAMLGVEQDLSML